MINLRTLQKVTILPVLSSLMAYNYWAQAMGLVMRFAKPTTVYLMGRSSDHGNRAARAMMTRDLDVSRAYIMLHSNRFNR